MNIKIVGSNCSNGIKLKKLLLKIANNYDGDVVIEFKDDLESLRKYNIKNKPGLVINGHKFSEGSVPSDREILKYIKAYSTE